MPSNYSILSFIGKAHYRTLIFSSIRMVLVLWEAYRWPKTVQHHKSPIIILQQFLSSHVFTPKWILFVGLGNSESKNCITFNHKKFREKSTYFAMRITTRRKFCVDIHVDWMRKTNCLRCESSIVQCSIWNMCVNKISYWYFIMECFISWEQVLLKHKMREKGPRNETWIWYTSRNYRSPKQSLTNENFLFIYRCIEKLKKQVTHEVSYLKFKIKFS